MRHGRGAARSGPATDGRNIGVYVTRDDLLGTLSVMQILGGMGNSHRGYVGYEGKDFQKN
jgi:hypothetical protein